MLKFSKPVSLVLSSIVVFAGANSRKQLPLGIAAPTPEVLLFTIYEQAPKLDPTDEVNVLYDLAIAATGCNSAKSADLAMEMYNVATHRMPENGRWEQMNRAAARKNALTVLSFSDPDTAAERFFQLEPSPGHLPNEDPRVDLARELFPRLWKKQGAGALAAIERLAEFTSKSGQYPYRAIGHLLPQIAKVDHQRARAMFTDVVNLLPKEQGIHRTHDDYVQFLRESWSVASTSQRRQAVRLGISTSQPSAGMQRIAAGSRMYFEYYLAQATVRLDSETEARVYDLLPFVDRSDKPLGKQLRNRYPRLKRVPVPLISTAPWRSAVFASPGHDSLERVETAFEQHHLLFLAAWAQADPKRALVLALSAADLSRRLVGLAMVAPYLATTDAAKAKSWLQVLVSKNKSEGADRLPFLVALARANFALGQQDEGKAAAWRALELALSQLELDKQGSYVHGEAFTKLKELVDTYGEFQFQDPLWYARLEAITDPAMRLPLLAKYVRGACRHLAGYQEPS